MRRWLLKHLFAPIAGVSIGGQVVFPVFDEQGNDTGKKCAVIALDEETGQVAYVYVDN